MSEKKVNCQFAVMTDTGEQPDAAIHCVGFEAEDGIAVHCKLNGGGHNLALMGATIVEHICKELKDNDSPVACAAFIAAVGGAMMEGGGKEAMAIAAVMTDPGKMLGALAKSVDHEKLAELLMGVEVDDYEEEDDDDGEPV